METAHVLRTAERLAYVPALFPGKRGLRRAGCDFLQGVAHGPSETTAGELCHLRTLVEAALAQSRSMQRQRHDDVRQWSGGVMFNAQLSKELPQ